MLIQLQLDIENCFLKENEEVSIEVYVADLETIIRIALFLMRILHCRIVFRYSNCVKMFRKMFNRFLILIYHIFIIDSIVV